MQCNRHLPTGRHRLLASLPRSLARAIAGFFGRSNHAGPFSDRDRGPRCGRAWRWARAQRRRAQPPSAALAASCAALRAAFAASRWAAAAACSASCPALRSRLATRCSRAVTSPGVCGSLRQLASTCAIALLRPVTGSGLCVLRRRRRVDARCRVAGGRPIGRRRRVRRRLVLRQGIGRACLRTGRLRGVVTVRVVRREDVRRRNRHKMAHPSWPRSDRAMDRPSA